MVSYIVNVIKYLQPTYDLALALSEYCILISYFIFNIINVEKEGQIKEIIRDQNHKISDYLFVTFSNYGND